MPAVPEDITNLKIPAQLRLLESLYHYPKYDHLLIKPKVLKEETRLSPSNKASHNKNERRLLLLERLVGGRKVGSTCPQSLVHPHTHLRELASTTNRPSLRQAAATPRPAGGWVLGIPQYCTQRNYPMGRKRSFIQRVIVVSKMYSITWCKRRSSDVTMMILELGQSIFCSYILC